MILTKKHKETFDHRGFIVMKDFFSREVINNLSSWLDKLQDKSPEEGVEAKYYETSSITGGNILVRVEHILGNHNPEITRLLLGPRTLQCLSALFGEPPLLFKEKVNYKMPGCRPDKLHQDQAAGWNAYADFFISMCVVIDQNRRDNAALTFLSSGNYEKKLMGEEWRPLTDQDPPYQPENEYTLMEADPGDVIFFDSYVPHGSPANNSGQCRRNIYLTFNRQSDGDMRDKYYRDKWKTYPPNQCHNARAERSYRV